MLHSCDSSKGRQVFPPLAGGVTMERVRFRVPLPHALVHALQELQALTSQSWATVSGAPKVGGMNGVGGGGAGLEGMHAYSSLLSQPQLDMTELSALTS